MKRTTDTEIPTVTKTVYETVGLPESNWMTAKPAAEAAPAVKMKPERLLELAAEGKCPHYRVDGGEPLFHMPTLRQWVEAHLVDLNEGRISTTTTVFVERVPLREAPKSLRMIRDLFVADLASNASGVYFLCRGDECVYVGKAVAVSARAGNHKDKDYDRAYYTPVASCDLDEVEAHYIRALIPCDNKCVVAQRARKLKETE